MKKNTDPKPSRRRFLSLGLLSGAGLLTTQVQAMAPDPEADETVSMLTPDGKLVEVPKKVLERTADRQKAGNQDILHWTETQNKTKS